MSLDDRIRALATRTGQLLKGKADAVHTHTAAQISNATTVGRNVLLSADAAAARAAIGAGTPYTLPASTETLRGGVELATTAEAAGGLDASRAVTPAGLKAMLDQIGAAGGTPGQRYRVVSCVIRNTGSGFEFISDTGHVPIGVTAVTQDADEIIIDMSFTGTKVGSAIVAPDEVLAQAGYTMGASVGTNQIRIKVGQPTGFHDYVAYNGSAWTSLTGFVTATTMSGTSGGITFTHQPVQDPFAGIIQLRTNGSYRLSQEGGSTTNMSAFLYPYNSTTSVKAPTTDMRFWLYRPGTRPVAPTELTLANSNIWVLGIFEVG